MTSTPPWLVKVEEATVRFGGNAALDHVELEIGEGEVVSLIGPNGAGKSTLVKLVLGIQKPSAGVVRRRPGLTVGYVPQRLHIDSTLPMTAGRFLDLPRRHRHPSRQAILDHVGATPLMEQDMHSLSGGEFQRVLLARALLRGAELLVLDEPGQGVDHHGQAELYRLIDQVRRERGCGVLIVSHDLHLVMAATDRVICLNRHVCCSGAPEAVSRHPEYLSLFGRSAAEALAVYRHHHDHAHTLSGEVAAGDEAAATDGRHAGKEPPEKRRERVR